MTTPIPAAADLDALWMPFTANRQFKKAPRLLAKSAGMHYWDVNGRQILDGVAGLWCVNAGHNRPRIVQAIQEQAAELDFAPAFQMGHPKAFELAERLAKAWAARPARTNRGAPADEGIPAGDRCCRRDSAQRLLRRAHAELELGHDLQLADGPSVIDRRTVG